MRKLIVSNLVSLDGFYEGKDRNLGALFAYFHDDYAHDENFDRYNAERLSTADTLLLSGGTSFLGFKDYWSSVAADPQVTVIRQEIATLINPIEKVVISDQLAPEELTPWDNTRIIKRVDSHREIAVLTIWSTSCT